MPSRTSPTLTGAQLTAIIDARPPEMAKLTRAVLAKMRERLPGAVEMVYDKSNSLVIGFCPTERGSGVINSIAVYRNWINLYFFEGDALPDPQGLLQGSGSMVRHIRIAKASDLEARGVKALMAAARKCADPPLEKRAKRHVILKQVRRRT
jgi:hypothetical protein